MESSCSHPNRGVWPLARKILSLVKDVGRGRWMGEHAELFLEVSKIAVWGGGRELMRICLADGYPFKKA